MIQPMRHRKLMESRINASRPLSYAVFDLMVEFILTHMRKNLLLDLYLRSIGVIHRLLCYQKKCNIRVDYTWKQLWSALISLLKFIINNEADLVKKCNIFTLALQVVNIFNLFITFGDTFLPSPQTYDDLYYEIIRMHSIFDQLYSMSKSLTLFICIIFNSTIYILLFSGTYVPPNCDDSPNFANCDLIVKSKYCNNKHYAKFCCRSCLIAGQIDKAGLA